MVSYQIRVKRKVFDWLDRHSVSITRRLWIKKQEKNSQKSASLEIITISAQNAKKVSSSFGMFLPQIKVLHMHRTSDLVPKASPHISILINCHSVALNSYAWILQNQRFYWLAFSLNSHMHHKYHELHSLPMNFISQTVTPDYQCVLRP